MKREYVRGNKEHWRDVYEWAFGRVPDKDWNEEESCFGKNTCIMLKRTEGKLFVVDAKDREDKVLYNIITTNPNWHEVKPWEKHYEPKPFDKVLGWNEDENAVWPDIFLYKTLGTYICARGCFLNVKPYNEEEYLKSLEKSADDEQ